MSKDKGDGPNYDIPDREPDIIHEYYEYNSDDEEDKNIATLKMWVLDVKDENNATMLYRYDNKYFLPNKVAIMRIIRGYSLVFKFEPESSSWHPWGADRKDMVVNGLKEYINREFEKEVLL